MEHSFNAGRRLFLRSSATAIPLVSLTQAPLANALVKAPEPPRLSDYTPVFFSSDEWKILLAACDLLIPSGDEGPGALETNVPIYIDRQMEGNYGHAANWYTKGPFNPKAPALFGYQGGTLPRDYYKAGLAALEQFAQQHYHASFIHLDAAQQTEILKAAEADKIPMSSDLSSAQFFTFLLGNTKEGYFCDPIHGGNKHMMAWKMIGFPGARASYLEWADQHDRHYPLGPVDIDGERG